MDFKHYEIKPPNRKPPEGWTQGWHGYFRLEEATRHEIESTKHERTLEVDCFLSIIEDISNRGKTHINLVELGAGWGEWCIALAGVVDFGLIPHKIKTYNYLAIEPEPYYYCLIHEHFLTNNLDASRIARDAISDKDGVCYFNRYTSPHTFYGQGLTFAGNFGGSKLKTLILALYHIIRGKIVRVRTRKLDTILNLMSTVTRSLSAGSYHVDIIQCDVQGVEDRVIRGAMESIRQGKIDYWLIGTHSKGLNAKCRELLSPWYDCIVDVAPGKDKVLGLKQDGTQLYRRREIV